jgi:hypothetical protein
LSKTTILLERERYMQNITHILMERMSIRCTHRDMGMDTRKNMELIVVVMDMNMEDTVEDIVGLMEVMVGMRDMDTEVIIMSN